MTTRTLTAAARHWPALLSLPLWLAGAACWYAGHWGAGVAFYSVAASLLLIGHDDQGDDEE